MELVRTTPTTDQTGGFGGDDGTHSVPKMSYTEFVTRVITVMNSLKGEGFTIQLGHYLDRVVLRTIQNAHHKPNTPTPTIKDDDVGASVPLIQPDDTTNNDEPLLDLPFLFTLLSLALNTSTTVRDRIELLFEVMHQIHTHGSDTTTTTTTTTTPTYSSSTTKVVTTQQVRDMIGYLQSTSQLVTDTQIIETPTKYPFQTYRQGTPDELLGMARVLKQDVLTDGALLNNDYGEDTTGVASGHSGEQHGEGGRRRRGGGGGGQWTCDDFHHVLKSQSVCAWGECYSKKKGLR